MSIWPKKFEHYKTSAYVKSYHGQTKWMYFFIENDDLFIILFGVCADIIKFDSRPVYSKEFLKTKTKSHGDDINLNDITNFMIKNFLIFNLLSSNQLRFCSPQLLSASAFKRV